MSESVSIGEMAVMINRRPDTIRKWELHGVLPENLRPERTESGRRMWTQEQVQGIIRWLRESGRQMRGEDFLAEIDSEEVDRSIAVSRLMQRRVRDIEASIDVLRARVTRLEEAQSGGGAEARSGGEGVEDSRNDGVASR